MKTVIGMAKTNWRNSNTAYQITGIIFLLGGVVQSILEITVNPPQNMPLSAGNYLILLPLCLGIFVCASNFPKLMNLGGKRIDFFKSCLLTYAPAAVLVSLISIIINLTFSKWMVSSGYVAKVLDVLDVFGFMGNGAAVAFLQMTAFLLLVSIAAHTLTLIQGRWYGWVTNAVIIAIISVFTPIAPLRQVLVWFFNMIIFHESAAVQILSCLVLGTVIYAASIIPIKSKQI